MTARASCSAPFIILRPVPSGVSRYTNQIGASRRLDGRLERRLNLDGRSRAFLVTDLLRIMLTPFLETGVAD